MIPKMSYAVGYTAEYGALQNNLFNIQKKLDKTMEKLSTGSRVNDMKDDMSAKAMADVLKSWKVGTDEAIENIKEFIAFTKTAEDALDKLQEILFDMKQTVDRLTGIDNPSENGIAQNELEANLMAYERIVEQTQFKGWKVFDEMIYPLDTGNATGLATFRYRNFRFAAGRENVMSWDLGISPKSYNMGQVIQLKSLDIKLAVSGGKKITTTITDIGGVGSAVKKGDLIINGIDVFEAAKAVDAQLKASVGINNIATLEKAIEYALGGNASVQVVMSTGQAVGGGEVVAHIYINTPFELDIQVSSTGIGSALVGGKVGKLETMQLIPDKALDYVNAMNGRATYDDGAFVELTYDGLAKYVDEAVAKVDTVSGKVLTLSEDINVNTNLNNVNVLGMQQAGDAKVIIEAAIQQIDEMRGILAAYQKQAEHLITNRLQESNVVEAQVSKLTETDYAKELAEFTKQQITQQAGINMLAQKRQMAQLITQLLR